MKTNLLYALGDSITYGFPYGPGYSWVRLVSESLKLRIINGGVNGDTTACMLGRLPAALRLEPSHIILLGGANDAYWGQPASGVGRNISEICERCARQNTAVILGMPTPVDEREVEGRLSEYRAFISELADSKGYPVLEFNRAFTDSEGRFIYSLTTDGCHPNIDGYEAMAEVAEKSLPKILF